MKDVKVKKVVKDAEVGSPADWSPLFIHRTDPKKLIQESDQHLRKGNYEKILQSIHYQC